MLTDKEKAYFDATRPLVKMEVALVRALSANPTYLTKVEENSLRYAMNLARLGPFRLPNGMDIDLCEEVKQFRETLIAILEPAINTKTGKIDRVELVRYIPRIQEETLLTRHLLLDRHTDEFGEEHLDKEVGKKTLVSVLGGGGGSGLVYVGAFKLLEDHGIRPKYIVGTSIGSIIGMFRALSDEFDVANLVAQSRKIEFGLRDIFMIKPPTTKSLFGLPAAIRLDLYPSAEKYFRSIGREVPSFEELKVPFEAVVCGIKKGGLRNAPEYYTGDVPSFSDKGLIKWRPDTFKWIVKTINMVTKEFSDPEILVEVVFGRDKLTRKLKVVDGVGFSCAIPGMVHYDIFRKDDETIELLSELMEKEGLAYLVDGGLVNNVPSRVAWEGVYRGRIGTRNAFILAFDSFSPQFNRNIFFLPAQRIIQMNTRRNLPFSYYTKIFGSVPNPFHIVSLPRGMINMFKRGIKELTPDLPFIHKMLSYVPGPAESYGANR